MSITKSGELGPSGILSETLYVLNTIPARCKLLACVADVRQRNETLGHVFHVGIKHMCSQNAITGLKISHSGIQMTC